MSVSELRKGLLDDSDYERVSKPADFESLPSFISGASPDPALRGTANHLFMQFASFDNVDANGVEAEIERLCGINMISAEQARLNRRGVGGKVLCRSALRRNESVACAVPRKAL